MKKILPILLAVLLLCINVLPAAAAYKEVNNDHEGEDPFFLDDCDELDGWISSAGVEVTYDEDEATEGFGSICFVKDFKAYTQTDWDIRGAFDMWDLSDTDYITFDFFVSDLTLIDSSYQITASLSSNGIASNEFLEWKVAMMMHEYKEGWNTIMLPVSQAQSTNVYINRIDNFRLLLRTIIMPEDTTVTLRIDNIRAHSYGTKAIMLIDCDSVEGWSLSGGDTVETSRHVQGGAALSFQTLPVSAGGIGHMIRQCVLPVPVDCSNADYLEFDLYVSDAYALRPENCLGYGSPHDFVFEITSSGKCDVEEYSWYLQRDFGRLKDGWNHIKLPIGTAGKSGGEPDMRRINYFRMFFLSMQTCKDDLMTVMIDNIYLSVVQDGVNDYAPEAPVEPTPEPGPEPGPEPELEPTPVTPPEQGETQEDTAEQQARLALTTTRAKGLAVAFVFIIIAVNLITVSLRKRQTVPVLAAEAPSDALVAAVEQAPAQQAAAEDVAAAEVPTTDAEDPAEDPNRG